METNKDLNSLANEELIKKPKEPKEKKEKEAKEDKIDLEKFIIEKLLAFIKEENIFRIKKTLYWGEISDVQVIKDKLFSWEKKNKTFPNLKILDIDKYLTRIFYLCPQKELNTDKYKVEFLNGIYDIKTNTFSNNKKGLYFLNSLNVNYLEESYNLDEHPGAKIGKKTLLRPINGNRDKAKMIKQIAISLWFPIFKLKDWQFFAKSAGSGKSTIASAMVAPLRTYGTVNMQGFEKDENVATLENEYVNYADENLDGKSFDITNWKQIIMGGRRDVKKLYIDKYKAIIQVMSLFLWNKPPSILGEQNREAFFGRSRVFYLDVELRIKFGESDYLQMVRENKEFQEWFVNKCLRDEAINFANNNFEVEETQWEIKNKWKFFSKVDPMKYIINNYFDYNKNLKFLETMDGKSTADFHEKFRELAEIEGLPIAAQGDSNKVEREKERFSSYLQKTGYWKSELRTVKLEYGNMRKRFLFLIDKDILDFVSDDSSEINEVF